MRIRHFLYNAFLIEDGRTKIAIDPGQYLWLFKLGSLIPEEEWAGLTHVLVTHGDPDHHWQSDRLAAASGAPLVCGRALTKTESGNTLVVDPRGRGLRSWVSIANTTPLDVGESVELGGVRIEAVRSVHGPIEISVLGFKARQKPGPTERVGIGSTGFKITLAETTIVNLGDSILLDDWDALAPDVLMLPIGGLGNDTWTMDVADAIEAVRVIRPATVIPCHYNVPFLWMRNAAPADEQRFKREVERLGVECVVMGRGDAFELVLREPTPDGAQPARRVAARG
ncbi:MAG: MBL fold metallo-hydrolase [Gaiellaceae bacterium]